MSYRQYRNYRDLVETTVDDCILYDRMQEVARLGKRYPDNAFIQMIFWELVLVAPEEHLRKLVDNYEKTRDKPGPIGWTRKDYEKFVEQVFKPVEKAVYEDGMTYEEALEKHECSKSYYRTRRNEARKMGLIRKKGNQWVYWE
ncbi:MAG: hypothetical protein D6784_13000 [Chloroflexi bacterium]|nr:MAG: hypothetical protein D6784_13000 [Chloroflexota bacterium]